MNTFLSTTTTNDPKKNDTQEDKNYDAEGTSSDLNSKALVTHNDDADHDEELDELDDEGDSNSTGMTATGSFSNEPPHWWSKFKEFLYPDIEDDLSVEPNYRYTPIISGVVIPFAILLEIPGLTEHWYIRTNGNKTVETRPNPAILDVGLGLSMGCALIANIALIMRFLERRVKTTTVICVVFLTIHDVINIIAVTIFGIQHRFDDGFTYGQSFWMTVCSTVASTVTNATLIFDLIRTPDFANSGSGLTRKQRSLIIIVIILLCYIAFGALIHCVLTELNFIDALYFTVCSIETIGFGDIVITTTGAKVFTCIYSILGILNLALAVSLTRETVIEALEASYRKRMNNIKNRRKKIRWARRVGRRWMGAVTWRLRESGHDLWVWNDEELNDGDGDDSDEDYGKVKEICRQVIRTYHVIRRSILHLTDSVLPYQGTWEPSDKSPLWDIPHPHGMHLNLEALTESQLEAAAMEAGVPLSELVPKEFWEKREKKLRKERERRERREKERRNKEKLTERGARGQTDEEKEPLSRTGPPSSQPISPPNSSHATRPSNPRNPSSSFGRWQSEWFNRLKRIQRAIDPDEVPLTHARLGRMIGVLGSFGMAFSMGRGRRIVPGPSVDTGVNAGANAGPSSTIPHPDSPGEFDFDTAYRQKRLKEEAAEEERKAFIARLSVVWTLFLVFWMVGSGIFMVTENWSFGNALYFCVIAFTTIGFGDFSPHSPAGRSVFVVWALLGVATMTILISVLAEAYTTRYQTVLKSNRKISDFFDKAVAKYRVKEREKLLTKSEHRNRQNSEQRPTGARQGDGAEGLPQPSNLNMLVDDGLQSSASGPAVSSQQSEHQRGVDSHAQVSHEQHKLQASLEKLERLPREILQHARSFQEHVQFFRGGMHQSQQSHCQDHVRLYSSEGELRNGTEGGSQIGTHGIGQGDNSQPFRERQNMPEGLRELLDDILLADSSVLATTRRLSKRFERLGRIERELLGDAEAKQVLFTLSIERSLKKMIEAAEEALESLEEAKYNPSESRQ
ncbi:voltage-gated potassium channel [Dendrothele bispora CBS 962.96]|uniref:Voltage-gated potassium channel n=1 Tax=Dendrothele bispora (strain CBS 962.96) TaxID=1314807 RepID=A0A4S8MVP1_DENBC|nr:voltage-gated potassium channel [Dendrothele bispora CBS 962.96]